jgi:hypothetical protein
MYLTWISAVGFFSLHLGVLRGKSECVVLVKMRKVEIVKIVF